MQRRRLLRAGMAGLAVAGLSTVAGCQDPFETVAGDLNESRYSVATDEDPTREEIGSVARNEIDELSIIGYYSVVQDDEFAVFVAVHNEGNRRASIADYAWDISVFDENDHEIETRGTRTFSYNGNMDPGERRRIKIVPLVDDPSAIARYEIALSCDERDEPYCGF